MRVLLDECIAWRQFMVSKEALLREVLKLSSEERAELAVELLASLESLPIAEVDEIEREWGAEIERRARRVLAGESPGVSWETIERSVRNRLAER